MKFKPLKGLGLVLGAIGGAIYAEGTALMYLKSKVEVSQDGNVEIELPGWSEDVHYSRDSFGASLRINKFGPSPTMFITDANEDGIPEEVSQGKIAYKRSDPGTENLFKMVDAEWNARVPGLERLAEEERAKLSDKPEENMRF